MGKGHSKAQDADQQFILIRDRLCKDFLDAKRVAQKHCEDELEEIKKQFEEELLLIQNKYDRDIQLLKINVMREKERAKHERNFFENKLVEALKGADKSLIKTDGETQTELHSTDLYQDRDGAISPDFYTEHGLVQMLLSANATNRIKVRESKPSSCNNLLRQMFGNLEDIANRKGMVSYRDIVASIRYECGTPPNETSSQRYEYEDDAKEGTADSGTEVEYTSEKVCTHTKRRKSNRSNYWQTKYFDMQKKYNKKMIDMEETYNEQKRLLLESMNKEKLNLQEKHIFEMKDLNEKFLNEIDNVRQIERDKYCNLITIAQKEADDKKLEIDKLTRELEEYKYLLATVLPSHNNDLRESLFKLQEVLLVQDQR